MNKPITEKEVKKKFSKIIDEAKVLFSKKTDIYGTAFFKNNSSKDWNDGFYGGLKRKWMRIENFKKKENIGIEDIEDTLMDMGVYCFMLLVAFDKNCFYDKKSKRLA